MSTALRPKSLSHPAAQGPSQSAVRTWAPAVVLVGAFAVGGLSTDGFLDVDNLKAILLASAFVGTIAVGMTFITLGGSLFSLSLGTTAAVTAIAFLYLLHLGVVVAALLALLLGGVICALQGALIGYAGANPIIVTIAAGVLQEGIVSWRTQGATVYPSGDASYDLLRDPLAGIPFPFIAFAACVIVAEVVLRHTEFGRKLYLVGDNQDAARNIVVSVGAVTTLAFFAAGACAAVAGVLLGSYNQNATLSLQGTYTFDAIAAVIVGGTAVTGGRGSVLRTFLGGLAIAAISSIALLRGYSPGVQVLAQGVIVMLVIVLAHADSRSPSE
jgi:ribose/xylose/arabinose/galactoside ABC-type transport system permease subunit